MTNIRDDKILTPVLEVAFYTLDKPFKAREAIFDETGRIVGENKLGLTVKLKDEEAKNEDIIELLELIKGVKITRNLKTGVKQFSASTSFKPSVYDVEGNEITAPQVFEGDILKVKMLVSKYAYKKNGGGHALNLTSAQIVSHDTSNRVEREMAGGANAFLKAQEDASNKLAALKG